MTLTTYIEQDPETKLYIGIVPGIPGVHSQGATLDELQRNMQEVLELCYEEQPELFKDAPVFVGIQQLELAA